MPREVGDWTRDKLKILELYLPAYLQATTRARERVYIDAFAGPGQNSLRTNGTIIDGSPVSALKAKAQNDTRFSRLFFIEQDAHAAEELRQMLQREDPDKRSHVREGDVNEELPSIIRNINPRSPTFVFIDPEGIDPRWTTIEAIAEWRTELLIVFPLGMAISRNPESAKVPEYFGTDEWRQAWESQNRTRELLDLYKRRLNALGYTYTTQIDMPIRTGGAQGPRLYYLIFVSKVKAGKTIMDWAFQQPDATGQSRMDLYITWTAPNIA